MGRFKTTGQMDVPGLAHSVADLPWGILRGVSGPSDGSAGAGSNVPSALAVIRHAPLYATLPEEIDQAFAVLERHVICDRLLYPVAVTIMPFLFDFVRRGSPLAARVTDLIAQYAAVANTLEPPLRDRLYAIALDHGPEVVGWTGRHDRAIAALAVHIPGFHDLYLAALASAVDVSPFALLALIDLGTTPGLSQELARGLDDQAPQAVVQRTVPAFTPARQDRTPARQDRTPARRDRSDAALPPPAPADLGSAITMVDAVVVFASDRLVLVRAGKRSITLHWQGSTVQRGDVIQVGITAHGKPKLVVTTEPGDRVTVIEL